jgi:hypothetical protein
MPWMMSLMKGNSAPEKQSLSLAAALLKIHTHSFSPSSTVNVTADLVTKAEQQQVKPLSHLLESDLSYPS